MKIEALDHVQLAMPEGREDEARTFYHDLLGIPEIAKPSNLTGRGGAWFVRDGLKIHLGVDKNFSPARKAHPAFIVTGLEELIVTLTNAGFEPAKDEPLEGFDRIYVHDPFGNRIELMEPVGKLSD
ncbi:MAG: VOC family protein [Geminicoccales bacterium]